MTVMASPCTIDAIRATSRVIMSDRKPASFLVSVVVDIKYSLVYTTDLGIGETSILLGFFTHGFEMS
jgi:hypothetical protein